MTDQIVKIYNINNMPIIQPKTESDAIKINEIMDNILNQEGVKYNRNVMLNKIYACNKLKQYLEVISIIDFLVLFDETCSQLFILKISLLIELKNYESALLISEFVWDNVSQVAIIPMFIGICLYHLYNVPLAIHFLISSIRLGCTCRNVYLYYGYCLSYYTTESYKKIFSNRILRKFNAFPQRSIEFSNILDTYQSEKKTLNKDIQHIMNRSDICDAGFLSTFILTDDIKKLLSLSNNVGYEDYPNSLDHFIEPDQPDQQDQQMDQLMHDELSSISDDLSNIHHLYKTMNIENVEEPSLIDESLVSIIHNDFDHFDHFDHFDQIDESHNF